MLSMLWALFNRSGVVHTKCGQSAFIRKLNCVQFGFCKGYGIAKPVVKLHVLHSQ